MPTVQVVHELSKNLSAQITTTQSTEFLAPFVECSKIGHTDNDGNTLQIMEEDTSHRY
jgi:hypothetical protein